MSFSQDMSISDYRKLSNKAARTSQYERDRAYHYVANPKIDQSNPYAPILANHMWVLFRELIDATDYETLVRMLHDHKCPCKGLLPKSLRAARNYTYREIKSKWHLREHLLFYFIEVYFFPELTTLCEACDRPGDLVYHHWIGDDGDKYDKYVCQQCNRWLVPKSFGYKESHHLPDWDTQREYVFNKIVSKL